MMNKEQYLLSKLAEEGAEVAQIALKCNIFGLDEIYANPNGTRLTNRQRLINEVSDLLSILALMDEAGLVEGLSERLDGMDSYYDYKKAKVEKYMEVSRRLGRLEKE